MLDQDLNELMSGKIQLQVAYIDELRLGLATASSEKPKRPILKAPRLDRR